MMGKHCDSCTCDGGESFQEHLKRVDNFLARLEPLVRMAEAYANGSTKDKVKAVLRRG